jgi:hypothetical protein
MTNIQEWVDWAFGVLGQYVNWFADNYPSVIDTALEILLLHLSKRLYEHRQPRDGRRGTLSQTPAANSSLSSRDCSTGSSRRWRQTARDRGPAPEQLPGPD